MGLICLNCIKRFVWKPKVWGSCSLVYAKMMKIYLFFAMIMVLTSHSFVAVEETRSPSLSAPSSGRELSAAAASRKLKNIYDQSGKTNKDVEGKISLQDYHPIDPSPSNKASTNSGPIEHGTPLIPYIPQPSPPNHPKHLGP